MWLKKNKSDKGAARTRQPVGSGGLGVRPVFSYHSKSAPGAQTGKRRDKRLPWATNAEPAASSRPPKPRSRKRILVVAAVVCTAVLMVANLFLSRDPAIVVHPQADGSQLLLRDQEVYQDAARAVMSGSIANASKMTIDTAKVAKDIQKQFPELGLTSVVLPVIGRQPVVHIQTARPVLVLASSAAGGVFLVDEQGRAIMEAAKASDAVKQKLPVVQDQSGLSVAVGDGVLPKSNIDFITEVVGQLSAKDIKVVSMVLPAGTSELNIRVEGVPYSVRFNLRGDARAEAGAFLAVKQHLEREKKTPSSYIDVRVPNKAYYR